MDLTPLTTARTHLGALVSRAHHGGHPTVITEHGKPVAAVVPISTLEDYEDAMAIVEHERHRRVGTSSGLTHEDFMAQMEAEGHGLRAS